MAERNELAVGAPGHEAISPEVARELMEALAVRPATPAPEPEPAPAPEPREDRIVSALMDRIDELQAQIDALTPVEATLEVTEGEPDESLADRVAALESRPLVPVSVSDTFTLLLRRIEALENPTTAEPEPVLAEDMETLMLRRLAELQAEIDALKGADDAG